MEQAPSTHFIDALERLYNLKNVNMKVPEDGLEGNTFIIMSGTQRFVAKVYGERKRAEAIAQFQNLLNSHDLPVPSILETLDGSLVATFGKNYIILSAYVKGEQISWNADFAKIKPSLSASLAEALANIHKLSNTMNDVAKIDHPLSAHNILSRLRNNHEVKHLQVALTEVRQSMIHSDLARENVFLTSNRDTVEAIIDFGDAHFDYITYDIATLLTQIYVTKSWGIDFDGIQDFLTVYNKHYELNTIEKNSVLPLMSLRNRGLLDQIESDLIAPNADSETLLSINSSLKTKLELLAKHQRRLRAITTQ